VFHLEIQSMYGRDCKTSELGIVSHKPRLSKWER